MIASCSTSVGRMVGRLGLASCTVVGMGEGEVQRQPLGVGLELGRGRVVEVERTPRRAVGCGRWLGVGLVLVELAGLVPEEPCGGCGGGGCGWYGGSVVVGEGEVEVEHSSKLDRLVHTLGRCSCIHKGWRLSFLLE